MFNLREFIKGGLMNAVGKMYDYQVILNAAGWHEKGVLTEEDLVEIQTAISAKNTVREDVPGETAGVLAGEDESVEVSG